MKKKFEKVASKAPSKALEDHADGEAEIGARSTCPCCQAILVVDLNLGRVVSHREPDRGNKPELNDAQRILRE